MSKSIVATQREERLNALIADYLDREAANQAPPRVAWLAEHTEFAEDLKQFLDEHERLARVGAPLRALAEPGGHDARTLAGSAEPTQAAPALVRSFGDYELLREIARGGMGIVFQARQKSLDRVVALKMILAGQLASKAEVERFRMEAHAAANLDHPQIVPIYEVGEHEGQNYFSMKYIEGDNLAQVVARGGWSAATPDDQRRTARLVAQAARAVHYAHQRGVIHRDLKPANILLGARPAGDSAVSGSTKEAVEAAVEPHITDFGLAKRVGSDAALTHTGAIVGTPSYMAPEQAAGAKQLTTAVDVYSLGAILYELLTGRPPFRGETPLEVMKQVAEREPAPPRSLNAALERDLQTICLKCLEKEPARRYRSADALAEDLERWCGGESIEARPSTTWERLLKWARRRPAAAALVGVTVLFAAALLIGGLVFNAELQLALGQVKERQHNLDEAEGKLDKVQAGLDKARARVAVQQKETKEASDLAQKLLLEATSLRLVGRSEVVRSSDPTLALLLALEAAQRGPRGADQNNALAASIEACRERGPILKMGDGFDVRMVRFFSDKKRVLTVSWQTSRIWDVNTGKKLIEIEGPPLRIVSFALSPDDRWLAFTYENYYDMLAGERDNPKAPLKKILVTDQVVRVYDAATGRERHVLRGHQHQVTSVAFSPDSKMLVTASLDGTARLWNVEDGLESRLLRGHECGLSAADFTSEGQVLTVSSGRKFKSLVRSEIQRAAERLPPEAIDPPLLVAVRAVAGSASSTGGGEMASGETLFACLWDAKTGEKRVEFRDPRIRFGSDAPERVLLSPDGKVLFAHHERRAVLWDAAGKEKHVLTIKDAVLPGAQFSRDGKRLATIHRSRAVRIWDTATGEELAVLRGHTDAVTTLHFSPDQKGRHLLSASADTTARVWDSANGVELFALRGHEQQIRAADFHPDGGIVVTGSDDGTARFWTARRRNDYGVTLDEKARTPWIGPKVAPSMIGDAPPRAIWSAALSPDGKRVALGYFDGTTRLIDVASGKQIAAKRPYEKHPKLQNLLAREVFSISWNPDGTRLLALAADTVGIVQGGKENERTPYTPLRLYDGVTGADVAVLEGHTEGVRFAHFSPDGTRILTVADDRIRTLRVDTAGVGRGQGSGNGKDRTARIFDAKTGRQLHVFEGDWRMLHSASWDADGRRVCTVHENSTIRIWDVATGKELQRLKSTIQNLNLAAFSPDGRRLMAWCDERARRTGSGAHGSTVSVWDLETGKLLFDLKGAHTLATGAAWSPDGKRIVTGAYASNVSTSSAPLGVHGRLRDNNDVDRTARIWDAETGTLLFVLHGHTQSVHFARFSNDSRLLVTASEDRTARVWDLATGKEVITLRGHEDDVKIAHFSADAKMALTVSWDGSARLWPVDPLPLAQSRRPRELSEEERDRFEVKKTP